MSLLENIKNTFQTSKQNFTQSIANIGQSTAVKQTKILSSPTFWNDYLEKSKQQRLADPATFRTGIRESSQNITNFWGGNREFMDIAKDPKINPTVKNLMLARRTGGALMGELSRQTASASALIEERGLRGAAKGIAGLPRQVREEGFMKTLESPEADAAFTTVDVLTGPLPGGVGLAGLLKQAGKMDDLAKAMKAAKASGNTEDAAKIAKEAVESISSIVDGPKGVDDMLKALNISEAEASKVVSLYEKVKGIPMYVQDMKNNIAREVPENLKGIVAYLDSIGENANWHVTTKSNVKESLEKGGWAIQEAMTFADTTKLSVQKGISSNLADTVDPVKELFRGMSESKKLQVMQDELLRAGRAERFENADKILKELGGKEGLEASRAALKGMFPKLEFDGISSNLSQTDIEGLFKRIADSDALEFTQKINATEALEALLEGKVAQRYDLSQLAKAFSPDEAQALSRNAKFLKQVVEGASEILNVPRSILASFDLSAPLRQGIFLISKPKEFSKSFVQMFKYAFSENAYLDQLKRLKADPDYFRMEEARLSLTEIDAPMAMREEAFISNLAEKIPLMGRGIRASNRAYTGFLNELRASTFKSFLRMADELKINLDADPQFLRDTARFINAATGRGELPGSWDQAIVPLSQALFSPRLMASRLQTLNPAFYIKLHPAVRKEAIKTLLGTTAMMGTVLTLADLAGADVGTDPTSADFLKIKVGNTRYDLTGGYQQYLKAGGQILYGQVTSTTTGEVRKFGKGPYDPNAQKVLSQMISNKLSPVYSLGMELMVGEGFMGAEIDAKYVAEKLFVPLVFQDMMEIMEERGPVAGVLMSIPAFFGVSTQTYPTVRKGIRKGSELFPKRDKPFQDKPSPFK